MSNVSVWYLPDSETHEVTGPLSSEEMTQLIEKGKIRADDFAWGPSLKEPRWHRVFEIQDFQKLLAPQPLTTLPKHLLVNRKAKTRKPLDLASRKGEYGIENTYRRYPRAPLQTEALIHNGKHLENGKVLDISEKGSSIVISGSRLFEKGEEVTITFRQGNGPLETFSVSAVVVRIDGEGQATRLGLFFLRLNPKIRRKIVQHVMQVLESA